MKHVLVISLTIGLLLGGCALFSQHILVNKALVVNETGERITDIRIVHRPTNKYAAVNLILPHEVFSLGVFEQRMLGSEADVSWRYGDGPLRHRRLTLPTLASLPHVDADEVMVLVYSITAADVVVHMVPAGQSPHLE